jgi:cytochrome b pre-mRNA-processing protein 3
VHLGVSSTPRYVTSVSWQPAGCQSHGSRRAAAVGEGDRIVAGLLGLKSFRSARRYERAGFALYSAAVAAARESYLYASLGVPDTLDGRFDLVSLYAFLLIHRLRELPDAGPALAQAVFDAMFSDMDMNLRELGVGDLSVGKRVRAMWEAFHGRANAYSAAIQAADHTALASALARNVWRGVPPPGGAAEALARLMLAQGEYLAGQEPAALVSGEVRFLPAAEAVR